MFRSIQRPQTWTLRSLHWRLHRRYLLYQRGAHSIYNRRHFLSPGCEIYLGISIEGDGLCIGVYYKPTDWQSYLLYPSSHQSHVKTSIPFSQFHRLRRLCSDDSDFPKNQRKCASFSINVAIMFLSLRRATTAPNKLIDSQHHKRLRRKILTAFYLLSHFTLTTTQLSLSLLTLNYNNCAANCGQQRRRSCCLAGRPPSKRSFAATFWHLVLCLSGQRSHFN